MTINATKIEVLKGEQGLTNMALSDRCGIKPQNISTIIRRGTCSPVTAAKLAKGLGVPVTEILSDQSST